MKTRNKALLLMLCAVTLVAGSVFGTMAYLTDTKSATNTFTVGSVGLKLDETKIGEDGMTALTSRTEEGNSYHLLPGHTYTKDPTVTVLEKSEDSYVRMMVKVDDIADLKAAMPNTKYPTYYNGEIFLLQMLCVNKDGDCTWKPNIWVFEEFHDASDLKYPNTYEFRYHESVNGKPKAKQLEPLFTDITVPGLMNNTELVNLQGVNIIITAHAIQADGFTDADAAWTAFDGQISTQ